MRAINLRKMRVPRTFSYSSVSRPRGLASRAHRVCVYFDLRHRDPADLRSIPQRQPNLRSIRVPAVRRDGNCVLSPLRIRYFHAHIRICSGAPTVLCTTLLYVPAL